MKFLIIIGFVGFFIYVKFVMKTRIKWRTFLRKGFVPNRGIFGVYCYCGKQGQGKTYSVVEFLHNNKDMPIYANLKSIRGLQYTYIANFEELLSLRSKTDCIIVYDEIFTALQKHSNINKDVLDFLSQMRKRRIICLTTAQEWAEIPLTWRRYCRYQIDCRLIRLPLIRGILIKTFKDAENMKWDNDEQEHVAPLIELTITHTQKWLADSYDTFEQISNRSSDKGLYSINNSDDSEISTELNSQLNEELTNRSLPEVVYNTPPQRESETKAIAREELETTDEIEIIDDIDDDLWKGELSIHDYE